MAITKLFYPVADTLAAPPFLRRFSVDEVNKRVFVSTGTTEAADWSELQLATQKASSYNYSIWLEPSDNGQIITMTGDSLNVTLPDSSTLPVGWRVTIVNENAAGLQTDGATVHTSASATMPVGQKSILVLRDSATADTLNGLTTQMSDAALILPPRACTDIWLTSSGRFAASPSSRVGWKDCPSEPKTFGLASKDPVESVIGSGSGVQFVRALEFKDQAAGSEPEVYYFMHLNHDYVMGTRVYPHVHWVSSNTTAKTTVGWVWTYAVARGFAQQAVDGVGTVIKASTTLSGTPFTHYVTEVSDANAIPATDLEPDTIIFLRLNRDSANAAATGDDTTSGAWVIFGDAHYLSTDGGTPLKAPPFYI